MPFHIMQKGRPQNMPFHIMQKGRPQNMPFHTVRSAFYNKCNAYLMSITYFTAAFSHFFCRRICFTLLFHNLLIHSVSGNLFTAIYFAVI